ncbi:MAG: hypothetical protein EXR72_24240 [Myxococcales bacterium]|nr:hypothetical protein [Myxococcales bacterium]
MGRRPMLLLLALAGCTQPRAAPTVDAPAREKVITLIATAEVRGTPEPCGCQSDPLGDIARVATVLAEARKVGGALLVDAGGLRYGAEPQKPAEQGQAELKANFLEKAWHDLGAITGVGDEDLTTGTAALADQGRLAANLSPIPHPRLGKFVDVKPHALRDVDGIAVGVFGLVGIAPEGMQIADPVTIAEREVTALRSEGAKVIVLLLHAGRTEARRIARAVPGIAVIVAGDEVGEGAEAEQVGETIIVQPAAEAQKVARVELHLVAGQVSTALFDGIEGRAREVARLEKRLAETDATLAALARDRDADLAFVKTQAARRATLAADRDRLRAAPNTPPAGSYAIASLVPIRRRIPRDEKLAAAMKRLDADAGEWNRSHGEKVPVPSVKRGEARYVGIEECALCHEAPEKEWKTTVHARGWDELVKINKQWSFDCIKCHVTGYGQAGGSAMAHVDGLTSVQCEVCHGAGSLHADKPKKFHMKMPTEADCKGCHTRDHSDTFAFEAYLRDVLGPGHGAKRRAALGDGKTGHELRHAAVERAAGK